MIRDKQFSKLMNSGEKWAFFFCLRPVGRYHFQIISNLNSCHIYSDLLSNNTLVFFSFFGVTQLLIYVLCQICIVYKLMKLSYSGVCLFDSWNLNFEWNIEMIAANDISRPNQSTNTHKHTWEPINGWTKRIFHLLDWNWFRISYDHFNEAWARQYHEDSVDSVQCPPVTWPYQNRQM